MKDNIFTSLRSRRYLRAQGGKLEIPPAQKLSILSSAHRAHGSAHANVFALENQSERELLITILAGLICNVAKNVNLIIFCIFLSWRAKQLPRNLCQSIHGKYHAFSKSSRQNCYHISLPSNKCWIDILCSPFKTMGRPIADK